MRRGDPLAAGLCAWLATAPARGEETQDDWTSPAQDFAFSLISENEILTRFHRRTAETELTAQCNNGIFNASDVLGLRTQISPAVVADVFLEPFVLLDANRTYDNNRLEMRASTRLNLSTGNITLQATAACVRN